MMLLFLMARLTHRLHSFSPLSTTSTPQQCILTHSSPQQCDIHSKVYDEFGRSTLHASIFRGAIDITRTLLQSEDVNIHDVHVRSSTLLIAACEKERIRSLFSELAKTFLRFGKWPKPKTGPDPQSSHHHVAPMMYEALLQLSKTNAAWHIPRHEIHLTTDIANHVQTILRLPELLLDSGCDVNGMDERGRTAIFEAVDSFSLPLVRLLLSRGANATHVAHNGMTPMQLSRMHGLVDISALLAEHSVNNNEPLSTTTTTTTATEQTPPPIPIPIPTNSREIEQYMGTRCDFDTLEQPSWSTFLKKYIRDHPRPIVVRGGFRQQRGKKKKKKKKRKKWRVPSVWEKGVLMRSRLSKSFVMVGDLPYGDITAPDSYQVKLPLKRFLQHHLKNVSSIKMKMDDDNQREEDDEVHDDDDDDARSRAYLFDPNILKSPMARPLLASLQSRRTYLTRGTFGSYVGLHQLSIGPHGSGAPVHFHEGSFSTLVSGDKLWAMWAPGVSFYSNVPSRNWWTRLFDNGTKIAKPLLCVQKKGEVIYVPPSWSHFTMVLSNESYSVADSFSSSVFGYLSPLHARTGGT